MFQRIEKIRNFLAPGEAALITDGADRRYLTGFDSSAGIVFVTDRQGYFLVDFRYFEAAQKSVRHLDVILLERAVPRLERLITENGVKTVYTECDRMSFSLFKKYQTELSADLSEDDRLGKLMTDMRTVKTPQEIALIKRAQEITDQTFLYTLGILEAGKSEREIALEMEFFLRRQGSEGVSFDFIVVSGKNSSLPHGVPTEKKLQKGDFVTMDFGAVAGGYRSDMTRTVCIGTASEAQRQVYETVLQAQDIAFGAIRPGVRCLDVDRAARDHIESRYPGAFGHGLGHGVGIEIHEAPNFNTRCETVLESGMVLTVEPGIYLNGRFGVRIEDMVVITEDGFENITKSPKELIEL